MDQFDPWVLVGEDDALLLQDVRNQCRGGENHLDRRLILVEVQSKHFLLHKLTYANTELLGALHEDTRRKVFLEMIQANPDPLIVNP